MRCCTISPSLRKKFWILIFSNKWQSFMVSDVVKLELLAMTGKPNWSGVTNSLGLGCSQLRGDNMELEL